MLNYQRVNGLNQQPNNLFDGDDEDEAWTSMNNGEWPIYQILVEQRRRPHYARHHHLPRISWFKTTSCLIAIPIMDCTTQHIFSHFSTMSPELNHQPTRILEPLPTNVVGYGVTTWLVTSWTWVSHTIRLEYHNTRQVDSEQVGKLSTNAMGDLLPNVTLRAFCGHRLGKDVSGTKPTWCAACSSSWASSILESGRPIHLPSDPQSAWSSDSMSLLDGYAIRAPEKRLLPHDGSLPPVPKCSEPCIN